MKKKRVAIIGGGIAGLSAAYYLEKASRDMGLQLDITLFEEKERAGGNILTEKREDYLIEGGPDCVFSEKPAALKLCRELGLEDSLLCTNEEQKGTYVYWNHRLHDLPEGVVLMVPTMIRPMIFSSLISLPGKMRMALEPFIPPKRGESEETLAEFVKRRLGKELLDKIAEPLVAGIHAGNPDTMSINASFPRFVHLEENHGSLIRGMVAMKRKMAAFKSQGKGSPYTMFMTLKKGLQEIPGQIVRSLKDTTIKCGEKIHSVDRKRGEYQLNSDRGKYACDALIVATPAYAAGRCLSSVNPLLTSHMVKIPYVSTATISLAYDNASLQEKPRGFGFIVPRTANRRIMAATLTSNKFSHRAPGDKTLIRVFVGGANNQGLVFQNDDQMVSMVREELEHILGITALPEIACVYRWKNAMPQYIRGHQQLVETIEEESLLTPGLFLTGSAYRGIGISDCISGSEKAAPQVLRYLESR